MTLLTTAPSVIYKIYKENGEVIDLTNPTNLPDPSEIEHMEEPIVSAEIMVTTEFIGAIMELCQQRRGRYISMEYVEGSRALLKYDIPLNEIIYDFFDALKSRSRGYASFDYELKGYEQAKLVKLDILINKEEVDALSFIVPEASAYERGRKMCEKIKTERKDDYLKFQFRRQLAVRLLQERQLRLCVRTFWQNVTVTFHERKLLEKQKNRRKERNVCVRLAMWKSHSQHLWQY